MPSELRSDDKLLDAKILGVKQQIENLLEENARFERLIVRLVLVLFFAAITIFIYAAITREWVTLVTSAIFHALLSLPIYQIVKLRESRLGLQIVPALLRLADSEESQRIVVKLAERLIGKI